MELTPSPVSGDAFLYSFTITRKAFHPWFVDKVPYVIAVVELTEQKSLRMVSNVVDCPTEEINVGMDLRLVFREISPGVTLPQFAPR
jgi:uncharacterized OB-fold protein